MIDTFIWREYTKQQLVDNFCRHLNKYKKREFLPYNCIGVYLIYNKKRELLYIGSTFNMRERIRGHIRGSANTKRFSEEMHIVKIIKEDSFSSFRKKYKLPPLITCLYSRKNSLLDIEHFLIKKLMPKHNLQSIN